MAINPYEAPKVKVKPIGNYKPSKKYEKFLVLILVIVFAITAFIYGKYFKTE
jgi:hypothetical protein